MESDNQQNGWQEFANTLNTRKDINVKDTFMVTDNGMANLRGWRFGVVIPPSLYTLRTSDCFIAIQSVAVAPVMKLPPASSTGPGKFYMVTDFSGSASATTITLQTTGTDTIRGATTYVINSDYGWTMLITDGNSWIAK